MYSVTDTVLGPLAYTANSSHFLDEASTGPDTNSSISDSVTQSDYSVNMSSDTATQSVDSVTVTGSPFSDGEISP